MACAGWGETRGKYNRAYHSPQQFQPEQSSPKLQDPDQPSQQYKPSPPNLSDSDMTSETWYPQDYQDAVANTLTEEDLSQLLARPGCAPRFVYGALMLPTVLKYFVGEDQTVQIHKRMTRATVSGYKLYQFSSTSTPVLRPCSEPGSAVEGMVVLGLDEKQRNAIYELEGGLMDLVSVQARIHLSEKFEGHEIQSERALDAGAFAWTASAEGLLPVESSRWAVDGFLREPFYEQIVASQRRQALDSSGSERPSRVLQSSR